MRIGRILNLSDELCNKCAILDRLGRQALYFTGLNLVEVIVVETHITLG